MLDYNQQRALCEYLDLDFRPRAEALSESSEFFPWPKFTIPEIQPEPRTMGVVKYTGLRMAITEYAWSAHIYGQRSDGQMFYVAIGWRPREDKGDPQQLLRSQFDKAVEQFRSYRDCSCGIIGYRDSGEKDEEGGPIRVPIHSPCKTHPAKEASNAE